jgi:Fic family protein
MSQIMILAFAARLRTEARANTIRAHLRELATEGYLAKVGKGCGVRYTLK